LPYIYESVIAEHYGWSLYDIRNMDLMDFYAHLRICLIKESVDQEFEAMLVGAGPKDGKSQTIPNKSEVRGLTKHTKTEKIMQFSSKVRPVKI